MQAGSTLRLETITICGAVIITVIIASVSF